MTIDKSGEFWVGSNPDDLIEYLHALESNGYPSDEARISKCRCGATVFSVKADQDEGCASRTCLACGTITMIGDSEEFWEDADPEAVACPSCGHDTFNAGVSFSLFAPQDNSLPDVRWLSVGLRCTACGLLGCPVDWKVGYGPSDHLLDRA